MLVVIGKKLGQTQKFLEDGTRVPVTVVATPGNTVMMHKTVATDGYNAIQLGFGEKKNAIKPEIGHAKKALTTKAPHFLREARLTEDELATLPEVGKVIAASTVLEPGDMVDVQGVSKGKGFAGGVKRYGFHGGPKTHGQSDRHRAPGSIGSGTTPGRVYRGKRMAGKMGNDLTTLKNLEIIEVGPDFVWVKGVVPGKVGSVVVVIPTGKKNKKYVAVLGGIKKVEETTEVPTQPVEETSEQLTTIETKAEEVKPEVSVAPQEKVGVQKEEVKTKEPVEKQEEVKSETEPQKKEEIK